MGQASQVKCVFVIGLAARRLARSTLGAAQMWRLRVAEALTGNKQQAGRQLLQEDAALAPKVARQQNQHGAWRDAGPQLGRLLSAQAITVSSSLLAGAGSSDEGAYDDAEA